MLEKIKNNNSYKKFVVGLLLFISLFTGMSFNAPTVAYADNNGGLGNFSISMDDHGLKVGGDGFSETGSESWTKFFARYKKFIIGVSGMATLTMIGIFIYCFIKLGASAGNEKARKEAQTGILWSGVATAGMGAVTLIVGFFYGSLQGDVNTN